MNIHEQKKALLASLEKDLLTAQEEVNILLGALKLRKKTVRLIKQAVKVMKGTLQ